MVVQQEETRKGPWTEKEDFRLMCYVGLFGVRRWDFIAKVSGLSRTGKSCRLRWVNYLQPGLKRGKMAPQEEKLVIELHEKWGNRWSRIARKLPGRTDNEIKNYWRTYTRKQAQERKCSMSRSSPSPKGGSSPPSTLTTDSGSFPEPGKESFCDTWGYPAPPVMKNACDEEGKSEKAYSMDDIWEEIESRPIYEGLTEEGCRFTWPLVSSLSLMQYTDSLWQEGEEESKLLFPLSDQVFPCGETGAAYNNADYL